MQTVNGDSIAEAVVVLVVVLIVVVVDSSSGGGDGPRRQIGFTLGHFGVSFGPPGSGFVVVHFTVRLHVLLT